MVFWFFFFDHSWSNFKWESITGFCIWTDYATVGLSRSGAWQLFVSYIPSNDLFQKANVSCDSRFLFYLNHVITHFLGDKVYFFKYLVNLTIISCLLCPSLVPSKNDIKTLDSPQIGKAISAWLQNMGLPTRSKRHELSF